MIEAYWLKIPIFDTPPLFGSAIGANPLEFHSLVSCGKTRMMGPPGDEKSFMVSLAVSNSIQYTNVTDRHQTVDNSCTGTFQKL